MGAGVGDRLTVPVYPGDTGRSRGAFITSPFTSSALPLPAELLQSSSGYLEQLGALEIVFFFFCSLFFACLFSETRFLF